MAFQTIFDHILLSLSLFMWRLGCYLHFKSKWFLHLASDTNSSIVNQWTNTLKNTNYLTWNMCKHWHIGSVKLAVQSLFSHKIFSLDKMLSTCFFLQNFRSYNNIINDWKWNSKLSANCGENRLRSLSNWWVEVVIDFQLTLNINLIIGFRVEFNLHATITLFIYFTSYI